MLARSLRLDRRDGRHWA